jgi:hypothetical protein
MVALFCFFLVLLALPFKSSSRLEAENAGLRYQLMVLQRKVRGRVHFTNSDRLFFIQLYRWFPSVLRAPVETRFCSPHEQLAQDPRGFPVASRRAVGVSRGQNAMLLCGCFEIVLFAITAYPTASVYSFQACGHRQGC